MFSLNFLKLMHHDLNQTGFPSIIVKAAPWSSAGLNPPRNNANAWMNWRKILLSQFISQIFSYFMVQKHFIAFSEDIQF